MNKSYRSGIEVPVLPEFFLHNFWSGPLLWAALFVSDYALTLTCARLYQNGVRQKIAFEGSFEITPYFQRDIDSLRRFSPRFIRVLVLNLAVLSLGWFIAAKEMPGWYSFVLGMSILSQLAIHMRHFRNLFAFRAASSEAVRGRIEYARPAMLRLSALELLSFSVLYLVLSAFTHSWFLLGGAFMCLMIALKHWRLATAHAVAQAQAGNTAVENAH